MRDSLRSKGQRKEMNKKRTEMKLLPTQDNNDNHKGQSEWVSRV